MSIALNKDKSIGKVLYIVEGGRTEPYILWKLFTQIFDYCNTNCNTWVEGSGTNADPMRFSAA